MKVISFGPLITKVVNIIRQNSLRLQLSTRHQKTQLTVGPGAPMAGCMAKELSGLVSAPWQLGKPLQLVGYREDFKIALGSDLGSEDFKTALGSIWSSSQKCCCQTLCFQGESQLPPASLGGSLRSAGGSEPCSFQLNCLCAGTWIM